MSREAATIRSLCTRRPRAVVLVAVLWVVAVLLLMVTVTAQTSRLDTRVAMSSADRIRCKWACRAGMEKAVSILETDDPASDSLYDLWSDNPEDLSNVLLDGCEFTVQVIDEAGKLNINTVSKRQLMQLPDMTEEIADCILDWRDGNDEPRDLGVESDYYINLPFGYEARNGGFRTLRELLLVKGVTPALLFGTGEGSEQLSQYNEGWINYFSCWSYDYNRDADGNARINVNSAGEQQMQDGLGISSGQARWVVENREHESIVDLLDTSASGSRGSRSNGNSSSGSRGSRNGNQQNQNNNQSEPIDTDTFYDIADKITITDNERIRGRVNVNTAPLYVLTALLEGNQEIAMDIIAYRESVGGGLTQVTELSEIESISLDVAEEFVDFVTTRSSVYTIRVIATGQTTGMRYLTEAVVDRSKSPTEILYYREGAYR